MKRRNFLAALLALPFATKPSDKFVGFELNEDIDCATLQLHLLYEHHRERVEANSEAIMRLKEALRQFAPTGIRRRVERGTL